jgi:hypothetical protein
MVDHGSWIVDDEDDEDAEMLMFQEGCVSLGTPDQAASSVADWYSVFVLQYYVVLWYCGIIQRWLEGRGLLCRLPTESPLPWLAYWLLIPGLCILYFVTYSVLRTTCSPWRPAPSTDAREKGNRRDETIRQ